MYDHSNSFFLPLKTDFENFMHKLSLHHCCPLLLIPQLLLCSTLEHQNSSFISTASIQYCSYVYRFRADHVGLDSLSGGSFLEKMDSPSYQPLIFPQLSIQGWRLGKFPHPCWLDPGVVVIRSCLGDHYFETLIYMRQCLAVDVQSSGLQFFHPLFHSAPCLRSRGCIGDVSGNIGYRLVTCFFDGA